jgi:hypothetical protein
MFMNDTQKELELTREQLARAERALEAIRRDVLPLSQPRYKLMAEGYVEQIQSLRAQIDAGQVYAEARRRIKEIEEQSAR